MNLSDEERRRIYEEEKARIEAQERVQREHKEQKAHDSRRGWLVIIAVIFAIWMISHLSGNNSAPSTPAPETSPTTSSVGTPAAAAKHATLKVVITTYEIPSYGGAVKIAGTMENLGPDPMFSPSLKADVYDKSRTLLGQDTAWPAGQMFSTMSPGTKAAFSMYISLHGANASSVSTDIWTDTKGATLDIHWPK